MGGELELEAESVKGGFEEEREIYMRMKLTERWKWGNMRGWF